MFFSAFLEMPFLPLAFCKVPFLPLAFLEMPFVPLASCSFNSASTSSASIASHMGQAYTILWKRIVNARWLEPRVYKIRAGIWMYFSWWW